MRFNLLSQKPGIEGSVIHVLYMEKYKVKKINPCLITQ